MLMFIKNEQTIEPTELDWDVILRLVLVLFIGIILKLANLCRLREAVIPIDVKFF